MAIPDTKIGIASDHAGFELKQELSRYLEAHGYKIIDYGTDNAKDSVDYPDFAYKLGEAIQSAAVNRGIAICGSGIGISIAVNRYPAVRGALVWDEYTAKMSRSHNDANVICLGARMTSAKDATKLVNIWLQEPFEGGRHQRRTAKLSNPPKTYHSSRS